MYTRTFVQSYMSFSAQAPYYWFIFRFNLMYWYFGPCIGRLPCVTFRFVSHASYIMRPWRVKSKPCYFIMLLLCTWVVLSLIRNFFAGPLLVSTFKMFSNPWSMKRLRYFRKTKANYPCLGHVKPNCPAHWTEGNLLSIVVTIVCLSWKNACCNICHATFKNSCMLIYLLIVVYSKLPHSHMMDIVINVATDFSFVIPIPMTYFQRSKIRLKMFLL